MRIGLVGAGRMGAFHAEVLQGMDRVELVIADAAAERAAELAARLGAGVARTPEEMIDEGIDALVIAAATPAHAPLIHLGADAGLPTFCEKPVALDLDHTDAVLAHVERAGTMLHVGFQRRFDAGYRRARELVATGRLGTIFSVRMATHDPAPPPAEYLSGSGGIYRDTHIHDFDILRWVTGEEVVEVYADGSALADQWIHDLGDIDSSAIMLRLESGAMAVCTGTRNNPIGYDVRMELAGAHDYVVAGSDERTPMRSLAQDAAPPRMPYTSFLERFDQAYRDEMAAFVDAVRTGGESPCSGNDARAALLIAMTAERSRAERRPVRVEEVAADMAMAR